MRIRHTRIHGSILLVGLLGTALALNATALAEESPRDRIQRLLPALQSEDDVVRERAESDLFAMGEAGRRELERLSRDTDPRRAVTALRLLQSDRWRAGLLRDGERRVDAESGESRRDEASEALEERLARAGEALDERFSRLRQELHGWLRHAVPDSDELPRLDDLDRVWERSLEELGRPGFSSSGTVVEDGRRMEWSIDAEGRVSVTLREGDGEPRRYEAESLDALRKAHPEVADRLAGHLRLPSPWPRLDLPRLRRLPDTWRHFEFPRLRELPEWPHLDGAVDRPLLGIEWAPPSAALRAQLRLPEGGVLVRMVTPGSLAEKLGMQRYDVLLDLGGRATRSGAEVRDAVEALPETGEVRATVIRAGERRVLTITR